MKEKFTKKNLILLSLGFVLLFPISIKAQQSFLTPNQAVNALVEAVKSADMTKSLETLFGLNNSDLWKTGDAVQDKKMKDNFLNRLAEGRQLVVGDKTHQVLLMGKDQWAFPIPLVKEGNQWSFDIKIGREEIINRRVGANELEAIQNVKDYVRAQKEYAQKNSGLYAQNFLSDPGKKNGLYWKSGDPQNQSPIGAKVLQATAEGYSSSSKAPALIYHGYYYRILKANKGFALVAYPAKWDDSGIMTFEVNQEGKVFQKNLGKDTSSLASQIKEFNADTTWKAIE